MEVEINENVKIFIEDNFSYIENKDLDGIRNSILKSNLSLDDSNTIYKIIRKVIDYNELLSKASIIPEFFFNEETINELVIPSNIKNIPDFSICNCDILRLFIAQSSSTLSVDVIGTQSEISNITQLRPVCFYTRSALEWINKNLIEWEIGGDVFFSRLSYNPFPNLYKVNPDIRLIIHKDVKIGVLNDPYQVPLLDYVQEYGFKNVEVVAC